MTDKSINYISKDNPYKIINKEDAYIIAFYDGNNHYNEVDVSKEIAEIIKESEQLENSYQYKKRRYHSFKGFDDSEFMEEILYPKTKNQYESLENSFIKKLDYELLYLAINQLNNIQKSRLIDYYFSNKTLQEIAYQERCSINAIKHSIDRAITNLKYFLKKYEV